MRFRKIRRLRWAVPVFLCALLHLGAILAETAGETRFAPLPIDDSPGLVAAESGYLPEDQGYQDDSLSVRIETDRAFDTDIMLAYVKIAHPSQMRTTMAGRYGTTKVASPAVLARRVNAVLAVNGDFFNYRNSGYLVRQGVLLRDNPSVRHDLLIFDENGDFQLIEEPTEEKIAAYTGTIVNSFNFGPALVKDGERVLPVRMTDKGAGKKAQRAAACQLGPLSYLFITTCGPENRGSVGLTLEEFSQYVGGIEGVVTAYNLDGGASSAIVLHGVKINTKKTRELCDMIYFSTLIPAEN